MATKVLTFLGARLDKTKPPFKYKHEGTVYEGYAFAEALKQFVKYDEMIVFVTDVAERDVWNHLPALNNDKKKRIRRVHIPTGDQPGDMWTLFETVVGQVDEADTVIFDVTQGLRSLPFLTFLFAAYLKSAKHVTISAVYYGAIELKDADGASPVQDLSEFVDFLNWISATDAFVRRGDGEDLAELLGDSEPDVTRIIRTISLGLRTTRPYETFSAAAELEDALTDKDWQRVASLRPFALISPKLARDYQRFALASPTENQQDALSRQLELVAWYFDHEQFEQVATLATEWIVSALVFRFGGDVMNYHGYRSTVEKALNGINSEKYTPLLDNLPFRAELDTLWGHLKDIRNDIAHCGIRKKADTIVNLQTRVAEAYKQFDELAPKLIKVTTP